jgi:predicted TIM-barrel fold metal-dependent hydrolase
MIQEAMVRGEITPELRRRFETRAAEILSAGAVGFGEMTALHLSFFPGHPFEVAPPDHPLFFLLADIAAQGNVPIDLHMEAAVQDTPLPGRFMSPPNPSALRENISAFDRLLSHNRGARIVWQHVGWDNTGHMTVPLLRRLLEAHTNLYMSLKINRRSLPQNRPLDIDGKVPQEWLDLLGSFPDRFVVGADQFFGTPRFSLVNLEAHRSFLSQLPPDLARKVGYENAVRLYRLN